MRFLCCCCLKPSADENEAANQAPGNNEVEAARSPDSLDGSLRRNSLGEFDIRLEVREETQRPNMSPDSASWVARRGPNSRGDGGHFVPLPPPPAAERLAFNLRYSLPPDTSPPGAASVLNSKAQSKATLIRAPYMAAEAKEEAEVAQPAAASEQANPKAATTTLVAKEKAASSAEAASVPHGNTQEPNGAGPASVPHGITKEPNGAGAAAAAASVPQGHAKGPDGAATSVPQGNTKEPNGTATSVPQGNAKEPAGAASAAASAASVPQGNAKEPNGATTSVPEGNTKGPNGAAASVPQGNAKGPNGTEASVPQGNAKGPNCAEASVPQGNAKGPNSAAASVPQGNTKGPNGAGASVPQGNCTEAPQGAANSDGVSTSDGGGEAAKNSAAPAAVAAGLALKKSVKGASQAKANTVPQKDAKLSAPTDDAVAKTVANRVSSGGINATVNASLLSLINQLRITEDLKPLRLCEQLGPVALATWHQRDTEKDGLAVVPGCKTAFKSKSGEQLLLHCLSYLDVPLHSQEGLPAATMHFWTHEGSYKTNSGQQPLQSASAFPAKDSPARQQLDACKAAFKSVLTSPLLSRVYLHLAMAPPPPGEKSGSEKRPLAVIAVFASDDTNV